MSIQTLDYWYDGQLRRISLQLTAAFSGFQVETGKDESGNVKRIRVPCIYAQTNRMAASILTDNSQNKIPSAPFISCYITQLDMARDRQRVGVSESSVDNLLITERKFDKDTGKYTGDMGHTYLVQRHMPSPFDITFQVDIFTTNERNKHELLEQILILFQPAIEIQFNTNPLDWTARSTLELTQINWSSRTIPIGTSDPMDVATLSFKVPIWLSPPAKVKQQKLIYDIINNIGVPALVDPDADTSKVVTSPNEEVFKIVQTKLSGNFIISIEENQIKLLGPYGMEEDAQGNPFSWAQLIDQYGELRPGVSQLRIKQPVTNIEDFSNNIIGTIQYHPTDSNILVWNIDIDTLPAQTLAPINKIIDPSKTQPGNGLPVSAVGQRYMIVESQIAPNTQSWGTMSADPNDIIEYNGTAWVKSFDASITTTNQIVVNNATNKRYRLVNKEWIDAVDRKYTSGEWFLYL